MIARDMTPEQRKQYCESVMQDWKDSGLNVTALCAGRGIPKARFCRHRDVANGMGKKAEPGRGVYEVPDLKAQPE